MGSQGSVQAQLHHQRLGVGELLLLRSVEWLGDKKVLAKDPLDYLKVLVGIVGLVESLLPRHVILVREDPVRTWRSLAWELAIRVHAAAVVKSLLLLFGALLEEDFSENIFFLFVRVIILHIIIMRLIKYAIGVMVAVRILVSDSSSLRHRAVRIDAQAIHATVHRGALLILPLACDQQDALVEATDNRYLRLSLLLLLLGLLLWLLLIWLLSTLLR